MQVGWLVAKIFGLMHPIGTSHESLLPHVRPYLCRVKLEVESELAERLVILRGSANQSGSTSSLQGIAVLVLGKVRRIMQPYKHASFA